MPAVGTAYDLPGPDPCGGQSNLAIPVVRSVHSESNEMLMRERRMLSHPFLIGLPAKPTIAAICLPMLYLWVADSRAMKSGTWRIESGTKLDYRICGLEVESVKPTCDHQHYV